MYSSESLCVCIKLGLSLTHHFNGEERLPALISFLFGFFALVKFYNETPGKQFQYFDVQTFSIKQSTSNGQYGVNILRWFRGKLSEMNCTTSFSIYAVDERVILYKID